MWRIISGALGLLSENGVLRPKKIGGLTMSGRFALTDGKMREVAVVWNETVSDPAVQTACNFPPAHCQKVSGACVAYTTALDDCKANGGIGKIHLKNDAKQFLKETISQFAGEHIRYNPNVPHDLQIKLGLLPADGVKKSSVSYDVGPNSEIILNGRRIGIIGVRYLGPKPSQYCICEIRWCFSTTIPAGADLMENPKEDYFSRNHWEHSFPDKRGQMFHYALRWIFANGHISPWSEVKSCSVP
jgi:hypothetical protein